MSGPTGGNTAVPTIFSGDAPFVPNENSLPTLFLPTLTPTDTPTFTPTPTATPGPCERVVRAGDSLITLANSCGHRDLDVIDEILRLNGLRSAESLLVGQHIQIPWPTPTPGPASDTEATLDDGEAALPAASRETDDVPATAISEVIPTPTLQPGVMWYTIQPGDNIIAIALNFNANVEILSQLNPEVTFSQCDFGMDSGGANCIVQLVAGQQLRVPAPSPTPTLSPTPSGSETPTPSPTATFNAPSLLSPGDRFLFGPGDIVTLRWVTTGDLAGGEAYRVMVTDTTLGAAYVGITSETAFIAPPEWQPADGRRHLFTWNVAVGPLGQSGDLASVTFTTPSRLFFWDSR